jgi:hypothetical protein
MDITLGDVLVSTGVHVACPGHDRSVDIAKVIRRERTFVAALWPEADNPELQVRVPEADDVPGLEGDRPDDPRAIDPRTVGGAKIFQGNSFTHAADKRVTSADPAAGENDAPIDSRSLAAEHDRRAADSKTPAGIGSTGDNEGWPPLR